MSRPVDPRDPREQRAASSPVTRVSLELTTGRQPLTGQVIATDGAVVRFNGWLELTAAIERARLSGESR